MSIQEITRPEWPARILKLMGKLALTQAGLAIRLGVSPATINRWIKGTHEPTSGSYLAMGNLVGSPEGVYFWERAGVDPSHFPDSKLGSMASSLKVNLKDFKLILGQNLSRELMANKSNAVALPLLTVTAFADEVPPGPAAKITEANVEDMLLAPLSWCPHPENMLCMHVCGDSMEPLIASDSIIAIDTAMADRKDLDKRLCVFSHRDLGFKVARLQRLAGSDILVAANSKHLPLDVTDQSKWKPIGAVLWWVSKDAIPEAAPSSVSS